MIGLGGIEYSIVGMIGLGRIRLTGIEYSIVGMIGLGRLELNIDITWYRCSHVSDNLQIAPATYRMCWPIICQG
jgi:hypothetical protein